MEMQERIDRIERENRRLKGIMLVLVTVLSIPILLQLSVSHSPVPFADDKLAPEEKEFKKITTEHLVVIDQKKKVRAELLVTEAAPNPGSTDQTRSSFRGGIEKDNGSANDACGNRPIVGGNPWHARPRLPRFPSSDSSPACPIRAGDAVASPIHC